MAAVVLSKEWFLLKQLKMKASKAHCEPCNERQCCLFCFVLFFNGISIPLLEFGMLQETSCTFKDATKSTNIRSLYTSEPYMSLTTNFID